MPLTRLVKPVSKHYFPTMPHEPPNPDRIAEFLVHIGRSARGDDTGAALTAAQWTALRFFDRATRASRTPSALASFQATTRGTASQTIKSLETRGLLRRHRSDSDGRSVCFEVTAPGADMLTQDPLRHLTAALARLDADDRAALARALPVLAADLAARRGATAFGTCDDCAHFECRGAGAYCACMADDLAPVDIGRLCARFAPGPAGSGAAVSPDRQESR